MKTNLITREGGYTKLRNELDYLWKEERPEVTKKVTWAASLGDRSENADYQYNKKRLREIDRRVRFLRKRLEIVQVVDYSPRSRTVKPSSAPGSRLKTMTAKPRLSALSARMRSMAAMTISPSTPRWHGHC